MGPQRSPEQKPMYVEMETPATCGYSKRRLTESVSSSPMIRDKKVLGQHIYD